MIRFEDFKIKKQLKNAVLELGFEKPTPIQTESYSSILSGSDFVGIAQTGTGKTIAYLLPLLQDLKFSNEPHPRILILAPTRELVIQIVGQIKQLTPYLSVRTVGVFGGSNNIKAQKRELAEGLDIIVGTPRRLYDLVLANSLKLKNIKKMVIDEVDIMLDFGYKTQLKNIFEHLPTRRQNILFSATMTTYVDQLTKDFLINPIYKTISVSGTPLENISQESYLAPNFYTKANLLKHILEDKETHHKVLVFVGRKVNVDRLAEYLDQPTEISIIHSSKEQNYRTRSIENFESGSSRILIATDVIARGIDIRKISTVVSFDTPLYPENYIHRIGRTGRAQEEGRSILFSTEKEIPLKNEIEKLMKYKIPLIEFPELVPINPQKTPEEKDRPIELEESNHQFNTKEKGEAFHEKLEKNKKQNAEVKSYKRKLQKKYKKPLKRGDKIQNTKKKRRR